LFRYTGRIRELIARKAIPSTSPLSSRRTHLRPKSNRKKQHLEGLDQHSLEILDANNKYYLKSDELLYILAIRILVDQNNDQCPHLGKNDLEPVRISSRQLQALSDAKTPPVVEL
jgi:hypothetical protein